MRGLCQMRIAELLDPQDPKKKVSPDPIHSTYGIFNLHLLGTYLVPYKLTKCRQIYHTFDCFGDFSRHIVVGMDTNRRGRYGCFQK